MFEKIYSCLFIDFRCDRALILTTTKNLPSLYMQIHLLLVYLPTVDVKKKKYKKKTDNMNLEEIYDFLSNKVQY